MKEATKRPWALRKNIPYDTGGWVIYSGVGEENETVARLPFGSAFPCPESQAKLKNDANAALIVRAVNTFDQAREALEYYAKTAIGARAVEVLEKIAAMEATP